jgi:peptide/nickel transport system ATP-binding protein
VTHLVDMGPETDDASAAGPLLEVTDLTVEYDTSSGPVIAVEHIDLDVKQGEFVGIVGESGCGKSTLLFAIAQLLTSPARIAGGQVVFRGRNMVAMNEAELAPVRWRNMSVVMQSAMNALNPVKKISAQYADVMKAHGVGSKIEIRERSEAVLDLVGIDRAHLNSYPHQLSGGMRQRAMIAMALLFTPELVIMDEPTSALDVVAQRSLMLQVKELQRQLGFAVIFVTHDMSLVSHFSDRLMVMYAAQEMEFGPTRQVFDAPAHPYSQGLMDAFPSIKGERVPLQGIPGSPPSLASMPPGCRFEPRCPQRFADCSTVQPPLYDVGPVQARCLLHDPELSKHARTEVGR